MKMSARHCRILIAATCVAACENQPTVPSTSIIPTIDTSVATLNSQNVLSATVSVRVRDADSVAVRFAIADVASSSDSVSPAVKTTADSAVIPVLGLFPSRRYTLRAVAYSARGNAIGNAMELTTDALPPDLPKYSASGVDPSPGYVVFAAGKYGLVIDNTGRVVWYRRFPNGPGLNFMAEPTGHYVARPTSPDVTQPDEWTEFDALGKTVRSLPCALGLTSRPHDLIAESDGSYWLMCDETRTMDLTDVGGVAGARVTGTSVQHVSASGKVLFQWSPFEHFDITDGELSNRTGQNVNWTHGNALDFDVDGNLLVSFRNLSEITKIDVASGAIMWRMGGRRNQMTFVDSSSHIFSGQHSARVNSFGELTILDNLGTVGESRAERYVVDAAMHTARLVHYYASIPGVVTAIGGSVQALAGGRTLVSFGTAGRVEEYDADGHVMWRIDGDAGYVFRAQRILSLYKPGVGTWR